LTRTAPQPTDNHPGEAVTDRRITSRTARTALLVVTASAVLLLAALTAVLITTIH
jgi:hypothetical protein